jgi:hypothetical protein
MQYMVVLLLLPISAMMVIRPYDLYARFFLYWLPYAAMLAALGARVACQWAAACQPWWVAHGVRVASGLSALVILCAWVGWRTWWPDPGYRDASAAALTGADQSVGLCAFGAEADAWQYYFDKPLFLPHSLRELQDFSQRYAEVRCVQYDAAWQGPEQTEIARFLSEHGARLRVKERLVYRFMTG